MASPLKDTDDIEVTPIGGSGLEGRGSLSKLKEIMKRHRRTSDSAAEAPDLEYTYEDTDTFTKELGELFTYSEVSELNEYRACFSRCMREKSPTISPQNWAGLSAAAKRGIVVHFAEKLEVVDSKERLYACMSLLYLILGAYVPGMSQETLVLNIRSTVHLMLECGVFQLVLQVLQLELEVGTQFMETSQKTGFNISHNQEFRVCLSLLYVFVETLRSPHSSDTPSQEANRKEFIEELTNPAADCNGLTSLLFTMLLQFCSSARPHYPIKKVILLIWKVLLAILGGLADVECMKKKVRAEAGLPPSFEVPKDVKPVILPVSGDVLHSGYTASFEQTRREVLATTLQNCGNSTDGSQPARKGLEFSPKVRKDEVDAYIEACVDKFGSFAASDPNSKTAGLPGPTKESIEVLKRHIYTPLSDLQIKQEDELETKHRTSFGVEPPKLPVRDTPAEKLYSFLVTNLPQYMISLLKVLLAASPTTKAKSDSLNILVDVLPVEEPATVIESSQLNLDIQRHKEVIVKGVSAILLLLLKHFKLNHIYQFEFMNQHLVFANCIPLVLKFFNQNVGQYVAAKNTLTELEFARYVTMEQDELSPESLEPVCSDQGYCGRNLFACINLLRILQKLTKWKHSRIMMMVVFKSAPILKRAHKVRHPLVRLYALKLLKAQTKYLGRNWRKNNMSIISSIYQTVRHHLHDDWAYGNDLVARPWDFQTEEIALRDCVDRFNSRYYGGMMQEVSDIDEEFAPVDNNVLSVLGLQSGVELTEEEMDHWEEWVDREVFRHPTNWDTVLENTAVFF